MPTTAEEIQEKLKARRRGEGGPHEPLDLSGAILHQADLEGVDLSRCNLSGADLTGANLKEADLTFANLSGANLSRVNLFGAELLNVDLTGANLNDAEAVQAGFGHAKLSGASFFNAKLEGATFAQADLTKADLRAAVLHGARFGESNLTDANLTRASMQKADLTGAELTGADLQDADLQEAQFRGVKGFTEANWVGTDIRQVDFCGAYLVRRHIMDENYLFEFRNQGKTQALIYQIWWVTSDCGRSFFRWGLWMVGVTLLFAGIYSIVDLRMPDDSTGFAPLYFSVVTLTTLGYGEITPASTAAQIWAVIQVSMGYVGLGGLLSILANKMARRAD